MTHLFLVYAGGSPPTDAPIISDDSTKSIDHQIIIRDDQIIYTDDRAMLEKLPNAKKGVLSSKFRARIVLDRPW